MDLAHIGRGFYRATKAVMTGSLIAGSGLLLYSLNNSDPDIAKTITDYGIVAGVTGFSTYLIGCLVLGTTNLPLANSPEDFSADLEQRLN